MHFGLVAPLLLFESRGGGRLRTLGCAAGLALVGLVQACADVPEEGEGEGPPPGAVQLTDANNYQSMTAVSMPPAIQTAPGVSLDVCWAEVTKDLQCHDLAPATDVDNVALLRFENATPADVEGMLGATGLATNDLKSYHDVQVNEAQLDPSMPCVQTGSMDSFGELIVPAEHYVEAPSDTYMLVLTRGTTPGFGAVTMVFVQPTATSTNTTVPVQAGCSPDETSGLLSFSANLSGLTPVQVPAAGPWVVDWSKVTRDGAGGDIGAASIDRLLIGFYQGKTVADLEANIFDLEYDDPVADYYTKVWEAPLDRQESADLALAVERGTSTPFPGFTQSDGIYVLGLMCGGCQNPAPIILTVLQPV